MDRSLEILEGPVAVEHQGTKLTVHLPGAARDALLPYLDRFRLPEAGDLKAGATALPFPFAASADFDRFGGSDLALTLVDRQRPERWLLVAVLDWPFGWAAVPVADSSVARAALSAKPTDLLFITEAGRCFCQHVCLSVASALGQAYESEWNGTQFAGRLEQYLPEPGPAAAKKGAKP